MYRGECRLPCPLVKKKCFLENTYLVRYCRLNIKNLSERLVVLVLLEGLATWFHSQSLFLGYYVRNIITLKLRGQGGKLLVPSLNIQTGTDRSTGTSTDC